MRPWRPRPAGASGFLFSQGGLARRGQDISFAGPASQGGVRIFFRTAGWPGGVRIFFRRAGRPGGPQGGVRILFRRQASGFFAPPGVRIFRISSLACFVSKIRAPEASQACRRPATGASGFLFRRAGLPGGRQDLFFAGPASQGGVRMFFSQGRPSRGASGFLFRGKCEIPITGYGNFALSAK